MPHIYAATDAAVVFGSAYSQCEDHFWQLEDTYIRSLGRHAEVVGKSGLRGDLEVALFELVERSKADFSEQPKAIREICIAFAAGYNYYLEKNPDVTPRLLDRMEPYHIMVYGRFMILGRLLGASHVPRGKMDAFAAETAASLGSNQWAIAPSKTRDGNAMLFINPHQPWHGPGMFTEMHVRSDEGWNFSGAMFPGTPFPTAGFNDRLGWAYTVNRPDISDVYRLTFDHPTDPLKYKYDGGYRDAESWTATIKVKTDDGMESREYTLRKSHYGPIIVKEDAQHYLAVKVPKLFAGNRFVQVLAQDKARNFEEWYAAVSMLQLQTFNTMYADADGNIFYIYNGTVARRNDAQDWTSPVDGSDPENEWDEYHPVSELPQVLNPSSGFIQNCNSTPFTTTDDGNPSKNDFPAYMVEDKDDDKRRAKMSRYLLRNAKDVTFEQWQEMAYDTTLYWPMTELPRYARRFAELEKSDPELAAWVRPYLDHLLDWDYRSTIDSTQTTLAVQWYEQFDGRGYSVEH
ncbi:MAG: penicillin acylase family protein, partial [Candidatus Hydrogenedentes bacterium]|nr:penicillin acylase family protein [Candidatus Hydrogenedentota bacterium]